MRMKRIIWAGVVLFIFSCQALPLPQRFVLELDRNAWDSLFMQLAPGEREEGIRDLLLLTLIQALEGQDTVITGALLTSGVGLPLRMGSLLHAGLLRFGPTRAFYVPEQDSQGKITGSVYILFPKGGDSLAYLQYWADRFRKDTGLVPQRVIAYAYSQDVDRMEVQCTLAANLTGLQLFTEKYGYFEQEVWTRSDLERFLQTTNDLVFARITGDGKLVVGGRNYSKSIRKLNLEDIAALYQGYYLPTEVNGRLEASDSGRELEDGVYYLDQYSFLAQAGDQVRIALESKDFDAFLVLAGPGHFYLADDDSGGDTNALIVATMSEAGVYTITVSSAFPWETGCYTLRIRRTTREGESFPFLAETAPGFSLDPRPGLYDFEGFLYGLDSFINNYGEEAKKIVDEELWSVFEEMVAVAINTLDLLREVKPLQDMTAQALYEVFVEIQDVLLSSSAENARDLYKDLTDEVWPFVNIQCPRYMGNIQGTKVAMTMYYCDLLGKLWAMGYGTPNVIGMDSIPEIPVASVHWEEIWTFPQARLWFEPNGEAVGRRDSSLYFDPVVTRLFAASSDPENPGEEVDPTVEKAQFIGWWNGHWPEIMSYEPQYWILNQIHKWSVLIAWLIQNKAEKTLNFLWDVPIKRDWTFKTWFNTLKDQLSSQLDLPFVCLDGWCEECLSLIRSEPKSKWGWSEAWLEGGVSTWARTKPVPQEEEVLARLMEIARQGGSYESRDGTRYECERSGERQFTVRVSPPKAIREDTMIEWVQPFLPSIALALTPQGGYVELYVSDRFLGRLQLTKDRETIKLSFSPSAWWKTLELARALFESVDMTWASFETPEGRLYWTGQYFVFQGHVEAGTMIKSGSSDARTQTPETWELAPVLAYVSNEVMTTYEGKLLYAPKPVRELFREIRELIGKNAGPEDWKEAIQKNRETIDSLLQAIMPPGADWKWSPDFTYLERVYVPLQYPSIVLGCEEFLELWINLVGKVQRLLKDIMPVCTLVQEKFSVQKNC
ncbi:MAG: hypothetical protein APU95_04595 [Hadesarchaea archaeon YNP_N21]|nr:MAG: hypothetical protein APU95_04595 [Hadesarchaea archaeon YNP_N21]